MSAAAIAVGASDQPAYNEDVVRLFTIATMFWGVVGFTAGTFIAFQLAYPALNLGLEWTTFGRLRPLHTSAVIFAFGGNALLGTSLYVVQRTCRARCSVDRCSRPCCSGAINSSSSWRPSATCSE